MSDDSHGLASGGWGKASAGWGRASGLTYLLVTFRLAIHPAMLSLAIAGVFLTTFVGVALDSVWTSADSGIPSDAIERYVWPDGPAMADRQEGLGVFRVFRTFEVHCVRDAIESVRKGRLIGDAGLGLTPVSAQRSGGLPIRGAVSDVLLMGKGVSWMFRSHPWYAILFFASSVLIWGVFGGAICRMAAIRLTREEYIPIRSAISFAWRKLFGGFALAPVVPVLMALGVGVLLMLGGLFLRIPWLGDVVGGGLFFLAILGGLVISFLAVGLVAGGPLFYPTIAVEGTDAFDSLSRSLSYVYGRPLKALWYALVLTVYGSFGWLFVRLFVWLGMASTHYFVDIGTGGALSTIWAAPTFERLHSVTGNLAGANAWAAGLIGFWSVLVIVGVWSFLVTFFFGGSTAAYFLLRQEVDGYDLEEIYEDDEGDPALVGGEATVASASPAEEKAVETEGDERKDAGDSKKSAVKNKKKKMKKSGERDQG